MKIEALHKLFLEYPLVSTDTRHIKSGSIFFALKGANFDGNTYAKEAIKKGASFTIIDNPKYNTAEKTIIVDDVLNTLQELATYHRNYCKAKIIALTGSNGKTTTKALINQVLS
ncbi:MAG: Mur ligase domain-containing protein, partial [Eudoraea sp.]